MDRRKFLGCCAATGLSSAFCTPAFGNAPDDALADQGKVTTRFLIADAHAHPYQLHGSRSYDSSTPTIAIMKSLGMALCSFSAVGDMSFRRGRSGSPFDDTQNQLRQVRRLEEKGDLRLILTSADVQSLVASPAVIGGLMAIEGGDALEGKLPNLDAFHREGVRLMTVVHDRDNEIGYNQRSGTDGSLTPFGIKVIERMNELGMVVDVAHTKTGTLKGIAEVCAMPLVDSHTSPFLACEEGSGPRRLRSWPEMELVARSGGVVCSWPLAYSGRHSQRMTFSQWAEEIVRMKARLGIEHCGLGTDGGGGLSHLISGWESVASLPELISALSQAGLSEANIAAFVGGNFLRVLGKCLV